MIIKSNMLDIIGFKNGWSKKKNISTRFTVCTQVEKLMQANLKLFYANYLDYLKNRITVYIRKLQKH